MNTVGPFGFSSKPQREVSETSVEVSCLRNSPESIQGCRPHPLDDSVAWLRLSEALIQGGREDIAILKENAVTSFSAQNTSLEVRRKMEGIRDRIISNPKQRGILQDIRDTLKLLQSEFDHLGPVGSPAPRAASAVDGFLEERSSPFKFDGSKSGFFGK